MQIPTMLQPTGVTSGGVVGPNPTASAPYDAFSRSMQQLLAGAASFAAGRKEHAKSEVDKTLELLSNGTITQDSIDQKKLLKQIKLAYPMLKTSYTPEELEQQEKAKQLEQQQQQQLMLQSQVSQGGQALSGMPGAMGMLGSQMQQMAAPPPQAPSPSASSPGTPTPAGAPNFMERIKGMFQGGPQPSMNSPVGQMLTQMSQEGQMRKSDRLEEERIGHALKMASGALGLQTTDNNLQLTGDLFQRMLKGDPQATEILVRTGAAKDLPMDAMEAIVRKANPGMPSTEVGKQAANAMLYLQNKGPEMKAKMLDLVKDMLPYYRGDAAAAMSFLQDPTNGPQPQMPVADQEKLWNSMSKILDAYQGVPLNLVSTYANATVSGQKELAKTTMDFISQHYKRANTAKSEEEWARIAVDRGRLADETTYRAGELRIRGFTAQTERMGKFLEGLNQLGGKAREIYLNQNKFTPQQVYDAASLLAQTDQDVAKLLKEHGGVAPSEVMKPQSGWDKGARLFGAPTPTIGPQAAPGDWLTQMMGQPAKPVQKAGPYSGLTEGIKQQLASMPKNLREAALSRMALPAAVKQELSTWDPEAEAQAQMDDFLRRNAR